MIVVNNSQENTENCIFIRLTKKEAEAILHSLIRTSCKGEQLTISMELEDKLAEVINNPES